MFSNKATKPAWTSIILLFAAVVVLTLISCRRSTPIEFASTPTLTVTAQQPDQPTPRPSSTASPVMVTQSPTPTLRLITPTLSPYPTFTPYPTFKVEKPLNDPGKYRLAEWNQYKVYGVVTQLEQDWLKTKQEDTWDYAQTEINAEKRVVALVGQEALLRFPDILNKEPFEWKIALDMATSGTQEATQRIASLLQSALDRDPTLITSPLMSSFSKLKYTGFTFFKREARGLFNDQQKTWTLNVKTENYMMGGGGAVFSVRENLEHGFEVHPIGGYWLPYWASDPSVFVNPPEAGMNPEVSILQISQHGTSEFFTESWLCVYQWQDNQWKAVLTNANSEVMGTFGLDIPLDQVCYAASGAIADVQYIREPNTSSETIQVSNEPNFYSCGKELVYYFRWNNGSYQQQAVVNGNTPQSTNSYKEFCLYRIWELGDAIQNKQDVIAFMEKMLADWPELAIETWGEDAATYTLAEPGFYNKFLFQLGRFYALDGDLEKAKATLVKLANASPERVDKWTFIARHYLMNIDDVRKAEEGFARDMASLCWYCSQDIPLKPIFEKAFSALITEGSLQTVENEIRTSIVEKNCFGGKDYECAELLYFLGLANEINGNEREAVNAYWLVWRNYPERLYSKAAQLKLERIPGP